ncbi:fluoride efflux transporter CrcB [Notoacmeibacter sp. MSK16QG-6]|uniref:fluoride efflux transporter CrcB n=1 Tax=Notoacmeibacter sp. MSK16QG-6 TaxID=2957982 RepID=UPI0020A13F4D|nr:fluoride efflux transporter CrcB [Notoacmeibacter sp. MSK16QG-6]MCP1200707.1 fluoride efflux transporter CrcB [Notoacmeibacter sp. MSK16QG-6]
MQGFFAVMAGGALGALSRHLVGIGTFRLFGPGFPVGTLTVNILGSFIMGVIVSWVLPRLPGVEWKLFLATGFLGGFTTFSSFSLDVATLWERGEATQSLLYVAASVVLAILALFAGLALGRMAG